MPLRSSLHKVLVNPKQLFLIDGLGALLSAFFLGVVLVKLKAHIGIPVKTLYFLAFLPCIFVIYDLICFYGNDKNLGPKLRGIAYMNLLYSIISFGFAMYHRLELRPLGWLYIVLEIVIILFIAKIELFVASAQS